MPKENGKIRSEYLLAALMCIAVAFFLTILIVSKSCSADLPEEDSSSTNTSSEEVSKPSASSTPSAQNKPVKAEKVPLGSLAKVTEGVLAPVSTPGTESAAALSDGGALVNMYSESKGYYSGSESAIPYGHSGTGLELRKDALYALNSMVEAFNASVGGKTNLIVQKAYAAAGGEGQALDENLATGCSVLFSVYPADPSGDYLGSGKYEWLKNNCVNYGYILRYPSDKTEFTNQPGDSRLFRYVGYEHAAYMGQYHLSLEEYLDVLRTHTSDNPLSITYTGSNGDERSCEVYFVPVTGGEVAELPILGGEATEFTYTGNGSDGIIVTCYTNRSDS